jgi:hypothetical protein
LGGKRKPVSYGEPQEQRPHERLGHIIYIYIYIYNIKMDIGKVGHEFHPAATGYVASMEFN